MSHGSAALAAIEASGARPLDIPLAVNGPTAAPCAAEAAAEAAAQLPVRITDYDPTELLIIQYTPGHPAARPPRMTVHQVAADAEIRLDGKTVVILENQRAAALLARDVLRLKRDRLSLAAAS